MVLGEYGDDCLLQRNESYLNSATPELLIFQWRVPTILPKARLRQRLRSPQARGTPTD
jgi:hypothetical protein